MVKWKRVAKDVGVTGALVGGTTLAMNYMSSKGGNKQGASASDKKNTGKGTGTGGTGTDESGTGSSSGSSSSGSGTGDGTTKTKVVEVPITDYNEALNFANREWNKIKRLNGRTLECQVQGSSKWRTGEWCKVYLPSFDIDGYMYIIRVSQSSEGGDWNTNLSLVDYPPGWGKEDLTEDKNNQESEENSDSSNSDGNQENTDENNNTTNTNTNNNTNNNTNG